MAAGPAVRPYSERVEKTTTQQDAPYTAWKVHHITRRKEQAVTRRYPIIVATV
ncbi:hypothetical protein K0M31_012222 [Melipona bicolor]|uniref:Uncharacterized protein n=1 Tax=Melipona bicolor TaxID=60889 RepID=A0AA40FKI6_9HYME|nr:hypothetical protein K0M31_012222 [Melipona bicolor]